MQQIVLDHDFRIMILAKEAKEALISKMHTIVIVFDVNFTRRVQSIYLFNFDKNDLIQRLGMLTWNVHCEPCKQ